MLGDFALSLHYITIIIAYKRCYAKKYCYIMRSTILYNAQVTRNIKKGNVKMRHIKFGHTIFRMWMSMMIRKIRTKDV